MLLIYLRVLFPILHSIRSTLIQVTNLDVATLLWCLLDIMLKQLPLYALLISNLFYLFHSLQDIKK